MGVVSWCCGGCRVLVVVLSSQTGKDTEASILTDGWMRVTCASICHIWLYVCDL